MNKQDLHRYRMTDTFTSDSGRLIGIREKTGLVSDPKTLFKDSISKSENIDKSNNDMYNCFAISYLFDDLFNGSKSNVYFCHHPLINLNDVPIDHKNRLSFLLPPEIFSSLEQKDKVVIKENKKNETVVIVKTNTMKITSLIFFNSDTVIILLVICYTIYILRKVGNTI